MGEEMSGTVVVLGAFGLIAYLTPILLGYWERNHQIKQKEKK